MQNQPLTLKEFQEPLSIAAKGNWEDYTIIEVDKKAYAINTKHVLEIIKVIELDIPTKLPSCILGILEYDGKPTGVIDPREVLHKKRITYGLSSRILVLKTEKSIVSIICDKVLDIEKINTDKFQPVPYQKDFDFYEGIYTQGEEQIYIINVENIVNYIETNIDKFQDTTPENSFIVNDEASLKILKERKNTLSKTITDIQTSTQLYDKGVSFKINDIKYYINMASVQEFYKVNNSKFIKIPNTPEYIFGLINIKGDYITILDIRNFFSDSNTEIKEKSVIIILNSDEFKIGILVDEILESLNIDFDEITQTRPHQDDSKMREFVKDGEIYQIIDINNLLKDERLISY